MSIVTLVSGGLDSTLMTLLAKESNREVFPLFINYGQLALDKELSACRTALRNFEINDPEVVDVSDLGRLLPSGLTDKNLDIFEDAFLPCRNLFFITIAASYAFKKNSSSIAIGLLNESSSIFPDQTKNFINMAEKVVEEALGAKIGIITPLMEFSKQEVVSLAKKKGIISTYSCHAGTDEPCGVCIACNEFNF